MFVKLDLFSVFSSSDLIGARRLLSRTEVTSLLLMIFLSFSFTCVTALYESSLHLYNKIANKIKTLEGSAKVRRIKGNN